MTGACRISATASGQSSAARPLGRVVDRAGAQQRAGERLLVGQVTGRARLDPVDGAAAEAVAAADAELARVRGARCRGG